MLFRSPDHVRVPLITNTNYRGVVHPSVPVIEAGDVVTEGELIASPAADGISNAQHASIDGVVTEVTDEHVTIEQD